MVMRYVEYKRRGGCYRENKRFVGGSEAIREESRAVTRNATTGYSQPQ
jgi:hypothetical protein